MHVDSYDYEFSRPVASQDIAPTDEDIIEEDDDCDVKFWNSSLIVF